MFKKIKILSIAVLALLLFIGLGPVNSQAHMMWKGHKGHMTKMSRMMKMKIFFIRHSVGFFPIVYKYHPGPMWILKNAKALRLTKTQIIREKALKKEMFMETKKGVIQLKTALKEYTEAAEQLNPSIKELMIREQAVGNAETYLGGVMIPYHIKGYRVLNASQMAEYHKLAAKNFKMKMRMMMKMMMKKCRWKMKMMHKKMHGGW